MTILDLKVEEFVGDMLTPEQVAELDRHPLIQVGAHSVSHALLTAANDDELNAELVWSRLSLEDWLNRRVDIMAYPYGGTNFRVQKAAALSGYRRAYRTEPPSGRRTVFTKSNPYAIPRYDLGRAVDTVLNGRIGELV